MTKKEKEKYLTLALASKRAFFEFPKTGKQPDKSVLSYLSSLPKSLFKYRRFDEFTVPMIEKGYFYLSSAEKLDDPFECLVDLDVSRFYDENAELIKAACFEMIVETTLGFVPAAQRERLRQIAYSCKTDRYTLNCSKALDILIQEQNSMPGVDVPMFLNTLANYPDFINAPETQENLRKLVSFSLRARQEIGICALTENERSQVMWAMYADNYSGYCIEYDFTHSVKAALDTYPVIYSDGRTNNFVAAVISTLLNGMVEKITEGKMTTDQTQYFRMFLTKSDEWAFQDEWRVIGDANTTVPAPPIKALYIGHKAKPKDSERMSNLSKRYGFKVFRTRIDHKSLRIEFDEI